MWIPRVEINRDDADGLHSRRFVFGLLDRTVVLECDMEMSRTTKRHKFEVDFHWQRIDQRYNTKSRDPVPAHISRLALEKIRNMIELEDELKNGKWETV